MKVNEPGGGPTPDGTVEALADRIRTWRQRHGMTQADLAVRSGTSVSFISMLERGERTPSLDTLLQLAQALDVPMTELVRAGPEEPVDDGYYRRLVEFAQEARLSRRQVDQLVAVGRAMFDESTRLGTPPEMKVTQGRRCSVPGCQRPLLARGMCPTHYRKKLRQKVRARAG